MEKEKRDKIIIQTSIIGIIGNLILVIFKAFVGFLANSISIINDAINNLTDALSSVITLIGTKLAGKRANKKHPLGFGRIEYITSSIIASLIIFAGGTAIYESIESIIDHFKNKTMPLFSLTSLIIIASAIIVKVLLGLFFKKRAKITESDALNSSGTDALFDSVLSLSTLIAALLAYFFHIYIEGYLGIILGLFILRSGIVAIKESLSSIVGERYDPKYISTIKRSIQEIKGVYGVYDVILNSYGPHKSIGSCHIGVEDNMQAKDIQYLERQIAEMVYQKFGIIMTIGIYALNEKLECSRMIKKDLIKILKEYDTVLQMHGFYVDEEKKVCNFDLVISFDDKNPINTKDKIKEEIEKLHKDYKFEVIFDVDFSLSE
jgi:cation diffusion facilitator family transporter